MKRLKFNILEISETRWPEDSGFWSDEFRLQNNKLKQCKRTRCSSCYLGSDNGMYQTVFVLKETDWWW